MRRSLLLLSLASLLVGCGFKLAGQTELSPELTRLTIAAPSNSELALRLPPLLQGAGVTLVPAQAASATLRIQTDRLNRNVRSVGGRGQVREFELVLTVRFMVETDDEVIAAPQQFELRRDYTFDEGAAVGSIAESDLLAENLYEEAAREVVRRLSRR